MAPLIVGRLVARGTITSGIEAAANGFSSGTVIGIVIGVIAVILTLIVIFLKIKKQGKDSNRTAMSEAEMRDFEDYGGREKRKGFKVEEHDFGTPSGRGEGGEVERMLAGSEGGHRRSGSIPNKVDRPREATAANSTKEQRYEPLREPRKSARRYRRERSGAYQEDLYQEDIHRHERRSSRQRHSGREGRNNIRHDQQGSNKPHPGRRESGQMRSPPGRSVGYGMVPGIGDRQRDFHIQDHDLGTPAGPERDAARMLGER